VALNFCRCVYIEVLMCVRPGRLVDSELFCSCVEVDKGIFY
jgi:hypothetical protein